MHTQILINGQIRSPLQRSQSSVFLIFAAWFDVAVQVV